MASKEQQDRMKNSESLRHGQGLFATILTLSLINPRINCQNRRFNPKKCKAHFNLLFLKIFFTLKKIGHLFYVRAVQTSIKLSNNIQIGLKLLEDEHLLNLKFVNSLVYFNKSAQHF